MLPLVLASASPRRRELLQQAGYQFTVQASDVPEIRHPGEDAIRFATRLARQKAEAVLGLQADPCIVLGADTVVVCDGEVMGKPADAEDAVRMLTLLAGRTHAVVTGIALIENATFRVAAELTHVSMRTLLPQEIAEYVATGEPMDKAGAYAIQGYAARWIPRISGCYFNVVGLPLALLNAMLER